MYDNIRISDADRERVTARLREHYAEGRLTAEELDERVSATLSAKTFGDLRPIMADLPEPGPLGPQPGPVPPPFQRPPYAYRRGPRLLPVAFLLLFLVLILPGAGWAFFAFVKFALLAWLVLCIVGIFTAARFRRRARRHTRPDNGDPWSRYTGRR
ncbi:MAG: DUF1707 SHOCT-like domain-containing protein [Streptosporangiaceae bacterium]